MKILFIVSTLENTGPTNQLLNLLKELNNYNNVIIEIVTLSKEKNNSRYKEFFHLGIKITCLNVTNLNFFFNSREKLKKLISRYEPNIIHSSGFRSDLLISTFHNKPKVSTIHNYPQLDYPTEYGKIKGYILYKIHTHILKKFTLCIACSKSVHDNLIETFNLKNISYIENGIDPIIFKPTNEKEHLRKKYNISMDKKVWISVGNINYRKNTTFLINYWKKSINKDILLIIGDGPLYQECKNSTKEYSNILMLGKKEPSIIIELLQTSDYYISASKAEGLPMAAIEALSCGLPVILSDIPPHQELLNKSKYDLIGDIFPLKEDISLIESRKKLEEKKEEIEKNCRNFILNNLTSQLMTEKYYNIYLKYIGHS